MLPVSGAEQLNTSGAHGTRPMISHSGAYSRFDKPFRRARRARQEQVPQLRVARARLQLLDQPQRLESIAGAAVRRYFRP